MLYDKYMSAESISSSVRELPASEARSHMAELLDAVADGEFIYLTRRGKRVAALMPADVAEHYEEIEDDYWARRAKEARDRLHDHPELAVPWEQAIAELEAAE